MLHCCWTPVGHRAQSCCTSWKTVFTSHRENQWKTSSKLLEVPHLRAFLGTNIKLLVFSLQLYRGIYSPHWQGLLIAPWYLLADSESRKFFKTHWSQLIETLAFKIQVEYVLYRILRIKMQIIVCMFSCSAKHFYSYNACFLLSI